MKKLMMAVMAVVGLGLGFAQAQVMDFDGRTMGALNFKEAIKTAMEKSGECHVVCDSNNKCTTICTYNKDTVGALAAVPAPTPIKVDAFDTKAEEAELNRAIGTAIKDCEKKEFVTMKSKFEKLLAEGLLQEKRDFVYNNKQTYEFPRRLFTGMEVAKTDTVTSLLNMTKNCVAWETKQECVTNRKEVCHTNCAAATLVCLAVAGVTAPVCTWAAPVCAIACAFVDDTVCNDVKYCTQYATWPGQLPQADHW